MHKRGMVWGVMIVSIAFILGLAPASMANEITITGEVNDQYQVIGSNGQVYEVAENEVGDDLIINHIGERVMVTGNLTLVEGEETQMLLVKSYKVLLDEVTETPMEETRP